MSSKQRRLFIFEPFTALAASWGLVELGTYLAQIEIQSFEKIGAMGLLGVMIWFSMLRQEKLQTKQTESIEKLSKSVDDNTHATHGLNDATRELRAIVESNKCKARDQG